MLPSLPWKSNGDERIPFDLIPFDQLNNSVVSKMLFQLCFNVSYQRWFDFTIWSQWNVNTTTQ